LCCCEEDEGLNNRAEVALTGSVGVGSVRNEDRRLREAKFCNREFRDVRFWEAEF